MDILIATIVGVLSGILRDAIWAVAKFLFRVSDKTFLTNTTKQTHGTKTRERGS